MFSFPLYLYFLTIQWKSVGTRTLWLPAFFKMSSKYNLICFTEEEEEEKTKSNGSSGSPVLSQRWGPWKANIVLITVI